MAASAGAPEVVPGAVWEESFAGRSPELAAIGRCRAEAAAGTPWVVVVEGEPGIGKTALAQRALAGRDGLRVCWCTCDRSEQEYPYGVVDQLLHRLPRTASGDAREPVRAPAPTSSPFGCARGRADGPGRCRRERPAGRGDRRHSLGGRRVPQSAVVRAAPPVHRARPDGPHRPHPGHRDL
ncbi:AAA family ATPase [Streptomyces sp. NBC_01614]